MGEEKSCGAVRVRREPFPWGEVRDRGRKREIEQRIGFLQDTMVWGSPGHTGKEFFPF